MILTPEQKELYGKLKTKLQRAFVNEYMSQEEPNQTKAYLSACKSIGQKPARNPTTAACTMLINANVHAFVESVKAQAAESTQINAEYVLKRLKEIDELDVLDIVSDDMSGFRPLSEWPIQWRRSISGIDINTIISSGDDKPVEMLVKKIKWPDKTKNLELLGKHVDIQAFKEKVDVSASDDLVALIQQGRKRVSESE